MSRVRVLVGTRKGAFILTSDEKRAAWEVSGPHFAGWEIYHMKGSSVDPNRIYASQSSGWFGQIIQRSDDGGKTWTVPGGEPVPTPVGMPAGKSNEFAYEGTVHTTSGTTAHSTRGSSSGFGILSLRSPILTSFTLGWRMRGFSRAPTADGRGKSYQPCEV